MDHCAVTDERAIAVIGVSCRLPGGIGNLTDLWTVLSEGRDVVGEMPPDRFEANRFVDTAVPRPAKSYTAAGGFLDDIAGFDAGYFGISPKEAVHMDPQHRLLLELTAEALDDAAVAPDRLAGSDTAVYVGISDASYAALQFIDVRSVGPYTMSGAASSIAANRLSHAFDLRGPSMAVDTACSSALVALDRACHTLWEGTSHLAVCGGANILLSPYHYVGFSQASMLSRRGHCASFSAEADGFVRAEGGGVLLLKPLDRARADGDRIHAVILGSASNSDGRTMGLSLPNPQAQEALLRQAYATAGVHPDELVYFEAHGTGTPVGDPAEAEAIGRGLGVRRISGALPMGSVKTNLGHLEPASGMAGICKALLVLRHRRIPASLHAETPHPDIDFTGLGLDLVTEMRPLPEGGRPVIGVNSFGFGGANAHTILAEAPPASPPEPELGPGPGPEPGPGPDGCVQPPEGLPVLVSARTPEALDEAVSRMAVRLEAAGEDEFYDVAFTSCRRRGLHPHRTAVLAPTAAEAAAQLRQEETRAAVEAVDAGRVAFVFSGNGSQWAGMGADLFAHSPAFRETVYALDTQLAPRLGWSVAAEFQRPAEQWRLEATEVAQPLLFALQAGLVAVLRDQGVEPSMVLGHSVGEVAAAYTCGALSPAQAAEVIAVRSRAQAATAGSGRMAAVGLGRDDAAAEIAACGGRLEIAGVNTAGDVTLAGPPEALAALGRRLEERGVFFRDLGLDYAFHSVAMDNQQQAVAAGLESLQPDGALVPFYSTVTGSRLAGRALDADYWWRNVREPVAFAAAVDSVLEDGADVFLEIGPHPVLRGYLRRITGARRQTRTAVLETVRRDRSGPQSLAAARGALIAAGVGTDWARYFPRRGQTVELPAYPWQRERHWSGEKEAWSGGALKHPLLGVRSQAPTPVWSGSVDPVLAPWLADHKVAGSVVMPATGYVEMALAAGRAALGRPVEVEHLDIQAALVVPWPDTSLVSVQTSFTPDDGILLVTSTDEHSPEPRPHARARVRALIAPQPRSSPADVGDDRFPRRLDAATHYSDCARAGLEYGPAFRVLTGLRIGAGEVLAHYACDRPADPYTVHPGLLDGALQAGAPLLADRIADGQCYLPSGIGAVRVWDTPAPTGTIHLRERSRTEEEVCWDITLANPDGTVTAQLDGCRLRRFAASHRTPLTISHTVLRAAPHEDEPCAPSPLPAPAHLAAACHDQVTRLSTAWRQSKYEKVAQLPGRGLASALAKCLAGLVPDPGAAYFPAELVGFGMKESHLRIVELLIPALLRYGHITAEADGRYRLLTTADDSADMVHQGLAGDPANIDFIALGSHHTRHLDELLRGSQNALELLANETSAHVLEAFYDFAPLMRFNNRLLQTVVTEMVRCWPADRPLRILEVGAGTGGTTAALLPLLPPERTRYCFTDIAGFFFPRAQARFAAYDFLDYRTLNLEIDPSEQGFQPAGFDLVVAGFSLHTARDLRTALHNVAAVLAPNGALLASEVHDPELIAGLFGFLDSFYGQTDTDLRPHSLLLPRDAWPPLLEGCGYTDVVQLGAEQGTASHDQVSVLLAQAAAGPVPVLPPLPQPSADSTYLLFSETEETQALGAALTATFAGQEISCAGPVAAPATRKEWEQALAAAAASGADTVNVVLLLGETAEQEANDLTARAARRADMLRTCVLAGEDASGISLRLTLVTKPSGAIPTAGTAPCPLDAAAWGVARTVANEHAAIGCRRIALDPCDDSTASARRLARELLTETDEDEIVLTSKGRFVPREQHHRPTTPVTEDTSFILRARNPGLSYELAWEETARPEPGPEEVLIGVRAAALNYRDIMQVTGLLPTEAFETTPQHGIGFECAGVVLACGERVTRFTPGDHVVGAAPAALSSHTVTTEVGLLRVPDGMHFTEAATMYVAASTVVYGLGTLARLQPGETVLVHGAAGAVGLAAVRYAHACGAHVIATAGNHLKRNLLRALGVEHVLDSRTLDFAAQVRELTGGRGIDVVLNSLAGEALTRSLELLRPGGRFVELGKRDIYENKPLLLRPFSNNIAFYGVDLTKLLDHPEAAQALAEEVLKAVQRGACGPLPHTIYPAARVDEAFGRLQHSQHIGKVVVAFDPLDEAPVVERRPHAPLRLNPDGTYLVTGGTGGFGAATAEWLATRGARHLALVSRRGPDAPEAQVVLDRLRAGGVHATAYAADAADSSAMTDVVKRIDDGGHPLRGVVHCAMHIDDDDFVNLDAERMAAVMAPKIGGAVVLDALMRDRDCDLFLLYSSATATAGNVRQAPYSGGNLFLEALARSRRQAGTPGLAVAWGGIADVGYVARAGLAATLEAIGLKGLDPAQAFTTLDRLLQSDTDAVLVARMDWNAARGLLSVVRSPRLSQLAPVGAAGELSKEEAIRHLSQMSVEDAVAYLTENLRRMLAHVMHMEPEQLDPHQRVESYGLDSLMGAELLVTLQRRYGVEIPPMELLRNRNSTLADIAQLVHLRLGLARPDTATAPSPAHPQAPIPLPNQTQPTTTVPTTTLATTTST
ncbi:SDR family NAD(P)-dependent oxidoreductase [Streptomyces rimosus]|uniref:SDR family NAD(P)-dependent oxidoreductase n=1 Tax=Streptomyces rimosus TaxID=1927 RepID=UPI0031DC4056